MFGLHLTIGISLTALFVSIAILLLRDVLKSDAVIESDVSIVNFIQLLRSPGMDATMMAATVLGKRADRVCRHVCCVLGILDHQAGGTTSSASLRRYS